MIVNLPGMFLAIVLSSACMIAAQSLNKDESSQRDTQVRGYWIDPSTGLMWAGKDSGKDLSWRNAIKYCRKSRLAGYSDWRLANMFELQHIYDKSAESPGLAGMRSEEPTTWHIKGNIFLTAYEWASRVDGRTPLDAYEYYFDFNEGKSNDQETSFLNSYSFRRALCVRGSGDPLGRR